jgi:hypothetical protein
MTRSSDTLACALNDLERISKRFFRTSQLAALLESEVLPELRDDDEIDLVAPITVEVGAASEPIGAGQTGKPVGKMHVGCAVTLADRAIVAWQEGTLRMTRSHVVVPYATVVAVNEIVLRARLEKHQAIEVMAAQRWPIGFSNHPKAPDMSFWRTRLSNRLNGTRVPVWDGPKVEKWTTPNGGELSTQLPIRSSESM